MRRTWDPAQHPRWLALEVDGQLQIRPAQYTIARHLMKQPGDVVQLNMGEGKTRVILPMLALQGADGSCVVRRPTSSCNTVLISRTAAAF